MILLSSALVLSPEAATLSLNNPVILYRNLITASDITATSEEDDYPASNLANPLTFPDAGWRATSTAEQALEFTISDADGPSGLGFAEHNFGTAEIGVKVERYVDGDWETLFDQMPASDAPLMFRFDQVSTAEMKVTLASGNAAARAAVVVIGPALVVQRRIWLGHTPITMGITTETVNGISQAGDYLGTDVLGETNGTTIDIKNLTPDWYRTYFDPFIRAAKTSPFFFAWRPVDYPNEVGYCWLNGNPKPVNQRKRKSASGQDHGLMSIQLAVTGIV